VRPLANILLASGLQPDEILEIMEECCKSADGSLSAPIDAQNLGELQLPCMKILCIWRRDARYVNAQGLPRCLPRCGQDGSFEALVRQADPAARVDQLLETLESSAQFECYPVET